MDDQTNKPDDHFAVVETCRWGIEVTEDYFLLTVQFTGINAVQSIYRIEYGLY